MGFLKRLLSVGGKKRQKDGQSGISKNQVFPNSTRPISEEQDVVDEDALVNRLLRSSSTHFSVISDGMECRSMPPIPHPINNVLRAPSIISSATQTDTYTVTVHRRMLHSRTEFPNANRSSSSSLSPPGTLSRRPSLPPLTPGDKNRLAMLRQDASVLSLLDIYDEQGNPNLQAFSNTPAKSEEYDPSLRALMGGPSSARPELAEAGVESDISWADRYIRGARRDSSSSILTTSSLGIPVNLFKASISPERLRLQDYDSETPISSYEIDAGIDSLLVERGTVEDTSGNLQPLAAVLTSPTRRASQFFKFLQDDTEFHTRPPDAASDVTSHVPQPSLPFLSLPPSPQGPRPIQRRPSPTGSFTAPSANQACLLRKDVDFLVVRNGPKQNHAQISPPPRRHSRQPPPPVAIQDHLQIAKHRDYKSAIITARAPFEELCNADACHPQTRSVSAAPTARSVSVASSIHPQIETQGSNALTDPYTPLPSRRGKREHVAVAGENLPPNAPARPVRGQSRTHVNRKNTRPTRGKETSERQVFASSTHLSIEKPLCHADPSLSLPKHCESDSKASLFPSPFNTTPPPTPKNPTHAHLQTPICPSPASSSELSPHGRQIMANIRAKAQKAGHGKTPRSWQPLGNNGEE